MKEHGMYFGKKEFYQIIRNLGGTWNDSKERPILCLIKSLEHDNLYWAIPVGNYEHRDEKAKSRIQKYMNYDKKDIRSCFYQLEYKLKRILAFEKTKPNYFRQHITDTKNYLISELKTNPSKEAL